MKQSSSNKKQPTHFDLLIDRTTRGRYRARVVSSPAGEAKEDFENPFSDDELENLALRLSWPRRDLEPAGDDPGKVAVRRFGTKLFETVFAGDVGSRYHASLATTRAAGRELRIQLRLKDVPELGRWPWELLYDPDSGRFLAQSPETPVVRYPESPLRIRPLAVETPLRILTAIAAPAGAVELDGEREWGELREALRELEGRGEVVLERLDVASVAALEERLGESEPCHVLHFVGHGRFDRGEGELLFEGCGRRAEWVRAHRLATLLRRHSALRLVVLNACEGGRHGHDDPWGGVAQRLMQQEIPAVVAMQFSISDAGAVCFARGFYRQLAAGTPVDGAAATARWTMYVQGHEVEWAAPVVYLRADDGRLFDLAGSGAPETPVQAAVLQTAVPAASSEAKPAVPATSSDAPPPRLRLRFSSRKWWAPAVGLAAVAATWLGWSAGPPPGCPTVPAVGVEWVRIEPGSFEMGSEEGDEDERPVHRVTISEPFCLGRYEVTQEQWRAVMGPESDPSSFTGDHRPVEGASWNQVQGFLAALNRRVVGTPFRLPTEAEWEYAARAGTGTAYSFGDDPAELYRHGNCLSDDDEDGHDRTAPVGSFEPNPWGLHDLHGNVSEWVADRYGPYPAGPVEDPTGPATGEERVRRGGSHENRPELCRSASRLPFGPDQRRLSVGFRLAASIDGEPGR